METYDKMESVDLLENYLYPDCYRHTPYPTVFVHKETFSTKSKEHEAFAVVPSSAPSLAVVIVTRVVNVQSIIEKSTTVSIGEGCERNFYN